MDNVKRKILVPLAVAVLTALHAHALTETVNGITWTYTVSNGKASVGSGTFSTTAVPKSTSGAITIPRTLGGYPVTSISRAAFDACSGITSVVIPDTVTSIGENSFSGAIILCSYESPIYYYAVERGLQYIVTLD